MASADLRAELHCSICVDLYTNPVTLPCGHNFCRDCIMQAWNHQELLMEYKCPECQRIYRKIPELKINRTLHNIAETFHSTETDQEQTVIFCKPCKSPFPATKSCLKCETSMKSTLRPSTSYLGKRKCSIHKKILEYYCTEDAACICVSCRMDGEHRGHSVETLDVASEKKKKKLRNALQKLMAETEEAEKRVRSLQERRRKAQEKADGVTKRVTDLFRDLKRQLEDNKKRVLSDITRWEEQISHAVSDLIRKLEIKKEELSRKMRHIEELCNMTDPLTVLQESDTGDLCDTEEGDNEDTEVQDGGDLNESLISDTLHQLSDIIKSLQICLKQPTDILLDERTAGNCVLLSGDLKTASFSQIYLNRPAAPERFQNSHILSRETFSSGQHCWEVETSKSTSWRLGVCYPSVSRDEAIGNNNKSWCFARYNDGSFSCRHDNNYIPLSDNPCRLKFRIYLDYDIGLLSFYELCDPVRHIFSFSITFSEPLHVAFAIFRGSVTITN